MMLEIFSNQSDGVVLLAKPQNIQEAMPVLYSNKAFKSVTRNQEGESDINAPILKITVD